MKVVTYSRVSTGEQNPEAQIHELRRYCTARGWQIVHELTDHGYSGGSDNRPGLKKLMTLARAREIDAVVCTKLDRFFRSLKHIVTTIDEFEAIGVKFVAIHDPVDCSSSSPASRLFLQLLGCFAEFERNILRDRTRLGLEHARRKGKHLGRPKTRKDDAIIRLREQGVSYTEIQKTLGCERSAVYRALKAVAKTTSRSAFQAAERKRHGKPR